MKFCWRTMEFEVDAYLAKQMLELVLPEKDLNMQ